MIYLDTHVLVWLYAPRLDLLSDPVRKHLDENDLYISPMALLELDYLCESGRIVVGGAAVYQELHNRLGLRVCDLGFPQIIQAAARQTWTRDPFDRIIVGHAAASGKGLVTRDETIRTHYQRAFW